MPEGSGVDTWAKPAGMDFTICSAKALFVGVEKATGQLKGKRILYRDDTNVGLSIVSDRFKVVQPKEILEFLRPIRKD